jgi:hypothetical protein
MSNDAMPCGCEGHADNADLCRYPALQAELLAQQETAERMIARARAEGRAEGFRAARERAMDTARAARAPEGMTLSGRDKVVFGVGVRAAVEVIRAMEDAGEGGEAVGHRDGCAWFVGGPCSRACATREPPLSQLRAATERMEAATQPSPAAMLGEAMELLARVVQLAQMGGASGLLVSSCQLALHNMRVEKCEAEAREGQG